MKKLFLFIFFFFAIHDLSLLAQQETFRVMTYNIRYAGDEKTDGENAWSKRKLPVSTVIRFHKTDLLGLQEALRTQIDDLIQLLPEFTWTGVGRDDGKNSGEFSVILYNKNKFSELDHGTFWLSETPDTPSKGWNAAFPRICTWIKLKEKSGNKEFFYFNTHLDHISEAARVNGTKLILKKITELASGYPVILTGDFNFTSSSDGYKILTAETSPVKDAQFISKYGHYGSNITFNDFGREMIPDNKIDFVFVNEKVSVLQHGVIGETFDGKYPSDHMPVVAEIDVR